MIPALALLLAACGTSEPPPEPEPEPAAEPAGAAVEVPLLPPDALRARLTGPESKPRIYNFWATWCLPCVAELPALKAFASEHPELSLVLVNVDHRKMQRSHVVPFLERHGLTEMTVVQLDSTDPATDVAQVVEDWPDSIPVTLVVNADGTLHQQLNGAVDRERLEGAVAGLQ